MSLHYNGHKIILDSGAQLYKHKGRKMKQYLDQLQYILDNGETRSDRTGTGTISVFGMQARYDLSKGFPAVTTKRLYWKGVVHELLWILKGNTNIKYLVDNNVNIWNDDAYRYYLEWWERNKATISCDPLEKDEFIDVIKCGHKNSVYGYVHGDLGPIYGAQWRKWPTKSGSIDQITKLIDGIKNDPYSRRHILSAWNVADLDTMSLPPCHVMAQFYVSVDSKLSCMLAQRSCDEILGAPFNIASYALFTHMIAQVCGLKVGILIHSIGDAHIYLNHINGIKKQLQRKPMQSPKLELSLDIKNIDNFKYEDIKLIGYKSHPTIKFNLSVGL